MTEFELATLEFQKWALIAQWVIGIGQLALIGGGLVMMQLAGRRRDRMLDQMMAALDRERDESRKRHEEAMAAQAESRAALEAVIKGLETVIERTGRGKE